MSLLADPRLPLQRDTSRWLLMAILVSFAFHLLAIVAYMWTPEYDFTPPPQAAPITVSIVAPLAAKKSLFEGKIAIEDQQQLIQQPQQPPIESVVEDFEPTVPVVESPRPTPVSLPPKRENPPQKKQPKKSIKKEIKPELSLPRKNVKPASEQHAINQKAQATTKLQTNVIANQLSAPRTGQLSEQGKAANISWKQALHAHLEREKRYPRKAKRLRKQGMPVIRFTMDRAGNVINVILVKSSGTKSLDKEAIDLVYRAQPLILPPDSISGDKIKITLPINFSF